MCVCVYTCIMLRPRHRRRAHVSGAAALIYAFKEGVRVYVRSTAAVIYIYIYCHVLRFHAVSWARRFLIAASAARAPHSFVYIYNTRAYRGHHLYPLPPWTRVMAFSCARYYIGDNMYTQMTRGDSARFL